MNIVVIGAQWGDEGKGKIVDYLAEDAKIVVRFSGGANAGHTIVADGVTYKLHLIPSGIVYPEKIAILGTGMVIDPEALFAELQQIEDQGIQWKGRILISDRAHLVLPRYKEEDKKMEKSRINPIGTTGRGIGITYAQKALREGIRFADLFDEKQYSRLPEGDRAFLDPYKARLKEMVVDIASFMAGNKEKKMLFEGAQGILLDLDIGTYPYVSSGYSAAAGASLGAGVGPRDLDKVFGVFKAYSTRVGNGPFPSEFSPEGDDELTLKIRDIGREFGVTTGRPRRCGYLDLVALKYACRVNGLDALVLTHLDVYDTMSEIGICVGYNYQKQVITDFPSSVSVLNEAEPVIKTFPGWNSSLADISSFSELPEKALSYIKFIEEFTGTPIEILSVGYKREQTMVRNNVWTK